MSVSIKDVKHFPATNHVEVTWHRQDGTMSAPDPQFPNDPQRTVQVPRYVPVAHRAYANSQTSQLSADLGAEAPKYAALIAQVAATYTPPPAAPAVPERVKMSQARLALHAAGKLAAVDAAINALQEPARTAARIEWEYSAELRREHPLVAQLAPGIGMTSAQIDALFITAATL